MRDGVPGLEMAEEMEGLARELLPLASPIMDHVHQRFLHALRRAGRRRPHGGRPRRGRRSTSGACGSRSPSPTSRATRAHRGGGRGGGGRAPSSASSRPSSDTLPDDARIIKTIGDEVMVVGGDPAALVDWAVGFQTLHLASGRCRASASTTARRSTATATTTGARSTSPRAWPRARAGGEVLVTRPIVEAVGPAPGVRAASARCGSRASPTSTELFLARAAERVTVGAAPDDVARARCARAGCCRPARPVVVLLSGGRDSVCLLDVAVAARRARAPCGALHVNYGLRARAGGRRAPLRGALRAPGGRRSTVERAARPAGRRPGNLQAWARDVRYGAGARGSPRRAGAPRWPSATRPPTRSRRSLYRLAASPGRRALLGMADEQRAARAPAAARGPDARGDRRVVRRARPAPGARTPRTTTRRFARAPGAQRAARRRCAQSHPAAEAQRRCARRSCCADEAEVLDVVVADGARRAATAIEVAGSRRCRRALARLVVRRLAEAATGGALRPRAARRLRRRSWRSGHDGARSTSATAPAPSCADGVLRFERTPPRERPPDS